MPTWIMIDNFGMVTMRPLMLSMSRVLVFCSIGADAEEEQGLCHRVEQDQEDPGPDRLVGADTPAQDDEPEVGHG